MFPENKTGTCFFPLSTIKKFHAEIVFEAWLGNLSGEVKIVYLLFLENSSRKCLILLLFYLPFFWLQISSAFAIIFAACHGLSCVHVRASWYTALFRVSLRGVGVVCSKGALGPIKNRKTVEKIIQNRKPYAKLSKSIHFHTPVVKTLIDPIEGWQVELTTLISWQDLWIPWTWHSYLLVSA